MSEKKSGKNRRQKSPKRAIQPTKGPAQATLHRQTIATGQDDNPWNVSRQSMECKPTIHGMQADNPWNASQQSTEWSTGIAEEEGFTWAFAAENKSHISTNRQHIVCYFQNKHIPDEDKKEVLKATEHPTPPMQTHGTKKQNCKTIH